MDAVIESAVGEARKTGPRRNRDRELLRYVGRHGVVRIGQVMAAMDAGRSVTYDRVAACVEADLLERLELVRSEPGLLRATRDGLRYAGLGLPVAVVSPGAVDHWLRCASTAQLLGEEFGHDCVLSEREIVLAEQIEERPIASAKVGELPNGAPRMHRADLAVPPEGHPLIRPSAGRETGPQGPSSPRTQGGWQGERTDSCVTLSHPTEGHRNAKRPCGPDRDRGRADAEVTAATAGPDAQLAARCGTRADRRGPISLRAGPDPQGGGASGRQDPGRGVRRDRRGGGAVRAGQGHDRPDPGPSFSAASKGRVHPYISGAARWHAGPVAPGRGGTRPGATGTVASYRLQEAAPGGV
jgi:hypothetical protein